MILASYCYRLRISKVIYGICKSKKGSAIIILRSLFAEAGGFEPFSFNSVYQLVLHLSRLLSVAFL